MMASEATAPATGTARLAELDVIRGFALFGVFWMNLFQHIGLIIPTEHADKLASAPVDKVVTFVTLWLAAGKAQALFSFLFGLGFALFLERAEARGANGTVLYVRRLAVLLLIGLAHLWLLWIGDILNAYALMGFVLILTRRWPGWLLLGAGVVLATFGTLALRLLSDFYLTAPGAQPSWVLTQQEGTLRRFALFQHADYAAYVRELFRASWDEIYLSPIGPVFLGWILGRFMIGSWVYRQGWMQDTARHAAGFRKWALILLPAGLLIGLIGPTLFALGIKAPSPWNYGLQILGRINLIVLPFGYAAALVVLCQSAAWRGRLSGLGAVGQMALTNYLAQSLVYMFLLYGFGFGLMTRLGSTMALGIAAAFFAVQVAYSRWWLARYRFGPVEWLWRSATYGSRQPMRLAPAAPMAASAG
jgi:uncharacterized protein